MKQDFPKGLPEGASAEDVQFLQHIEAAREDVAAGRVISQDEFERRIIRWLR